ncbi:hypothetical protein HK100_011134 [Physocladia obscura]|uniref:AB hydrolase-1 domain-containing protein n=1 Tax=Physocladia obscura TaxID=109957 RepID=A0AAD5XGU0_9FUNG|nr:hypothetical protein HK100_011134 [Physocladia obscura]
MNVDEETIITVLVLGVLVALVIINYTASIYYNNNATKVTLVYSLSTTPISSVTNNTNSSSDGKANSSITSIVNSTSTLATIPFATFVRRNCPSLVGNFRPIWWLNSGHAQTIFASTLATSKHVEFERETLILPDNGRVAIDWAPQNHQILPEETPIVILMHGLGGGSRDKYITDMIPSILRHGYKAAAVNSRGCGGLAVDTPQLYSGSWTCDMRAMVSHIRNTNPRAVIIGIGFSLGANIITKMAGEDGVECLLDALVAVANPFDLLVGQGFLESSWIGKEVYSRAMANSLKAFFNQHSQIFKKHPNVSTFTYPISINQVESSTYLSEFDEACTSRMFGYRSASEYYRCGSSAPFIPDITIPTLFLSDLDDPIAVSQAIPQYDIVLNPNIVLALTRRGGHLGWYEGKFFLPQRWYTKPIMEFCKAIIEAKQSLPDDLKSKFFEGGKQAVSKLNNQFDSHYIPPSIKASLLQQEPHEQQEKRIEKKSLHTQTDVANVEKQKQDVANKTANIDKRQISVSVVYKFLQKFVESRSVEGLAAGKIFGFILAMYYFFWKPSRNSIKI